MKHETILVPVKCSERPPSKYKKYLTDLGELMFDEDDDGQLWLNDKDEILYPEFWYEEQHDKIVLSEEEFRKLIDSFRSVINTFNNYWAREEDTYFATPKVISDAREMLLNIDK